MRTVAELRTQIARLQRQMAYFAARGQQFTSSLVRARHDLQVLTDANKEKRTIAIERITQALEPVPALAQFDARNSSTPGHACPECAKGVPCPSCYATWYRKQEEERLSGDKALEEAIAADARAVLAKAAEDAAKAATDADGEPHQDPATDT